MFYIFALDAHFSYMAVDLYMLMMVHGKCPYLHGVTIHLVQLIDLIWLV